eukprot:TRINITY_DN8926_c0_g1_i1.p1 TRINITY_DN8926_c0_g1~~TRINITY_DN8926_c0_g1_i1.p1  ORF type:complete len:225 (+),score=42.88 TRINITY_DN8926_c0_g1_i1:71-745(+)
MEGLDYNQVESSLRAAYESLSSDTLKIELDKALKLVFGGELPANATSALCGKIWGAGHTAYRCIDCQVTPNSCICIDCFQNGEHAGHDCRVYSSGYGGCCDCGDPGAWKPSGNCKHHKGSDTSDVKHSEEGAKKAIKAVLTILAEELTDFTDLGKDASDEDVRLIPDLIEWIDKVSTFTDKLRGLTGAIALELSSSDSSASFLRVCFKACCSEIDSMADQVTKI